MFYPKLMHYNEYTMPNDGKRFEPREQHFLVRFGVLFIMLRSIRDGTFFIYPYLVKDAPANIVSLLVVTNIITIISLGLLSGWFKFGFWIFAGIQIVNVPLCLSAGIGNIQSFIGVISAVILWLFMQIPTKGGYSTWEYLSGNYTTIRDRETTVKNKKCRMCETIYTGSLMACPSCGSALYEETTEDIFTDRKEETPETVESNEVKSDINSDDKKAEIERLEKLFDATTDENEKSLIAKQLYELGVMYYWRFMPKEQRAMKKE